MATHPFLQALGERVRALRTQAGLSQLRLARLAGLSPRYVSQLEAGRGNISVLRLHEVAHALGVSLSELVRVRSRPGLVALIGLRGAGKSSVGPALAKRLGVPFHELDALVEERAGLGLDEIFALHGEDYYRRLEREALTQLVAEDRSAVLATGGSLVTDRATYDLLEANALTIWLKARPEQHLGRVAAQGDRRPMAGRADPLAELQSLLRSREPLYAEAALTVDTSGRSVTEVVSHLAARLSSDPPHASATAS